MKGRVDSKEEKEGEQTQITPRHIKIRFVVRPLRMGWQLARSNKHLPMSSYNVTLKVASPSFSVLAIIRILSSEEGSEGGATNARVALGHFSRENWCRMKSTLYFASAPLLVRLLPVPPSRSRCLPARSALLSRVCVMDCLSPARRRPGCSGTRQLPSNTRNLSSDSPHRSLFASNLSGGPRKPKRPTTDAFSGIEPFFKAPRQ